MTEISSATPPWEPPRTKPYSGRAGEAIRDFDPKLQLAYEGSEATKVVWDLGEAEIRDPRRTVLDEIGSARGMTQAARGFIDDVESAVGRYRAAGVDVDASMQSIDGFKQLVARNGDIGALDALIGARRVIMPTWSSKNPGKPGLEVPRYNADGNVYAGDADRLDTPRVVLDVPTDLSASERANWLALRNHEPAPGERLESATRHFHADPRTGAAGDNMLMRLDNVIARMPKAVIDSLQPDEWRGILDARRQLLPKYEDALQWNDGTPPDFTEARRLLDELDRVLDIPLTAVEGVTEAEEGATRATVAAERLAQQAKGRKAVGIAVAALAAIGAAIGTTVAVAQRGDSATTSEGDAPGAGGTVVENDGFSVDSHRGLRIAGAALGLGVAGAGVAALAMTRVPRGPVQAFMHTVPWAMPAAIGAAALGSLAGGGALIGLSPSMKEFDQVVEGSITDANLAAVQRDGDVGVLQIGRGGDRWGLVDVGADTTDARGADSVQISKPPVKFAAVVSRDGDAWVRQGQAGGLRNVGAPGAVDATAIDASDTAAVTALAGTRVAVSEDGARELALGAPLLDGATFGSRADAVAALFEAGVDSAALVELGGRFVAFEATGAAAQEDPGALRARGTGIHPLGAVSLLSDVSTAPSVAVLPEFGAALGSSAAARPAVDVAGLALADVGTLTGRRVAGSGGEVQRLGAPEATFPTTEAAVADAGARAGRHLVVQVADGAAVFELQQAGTDHLATALAPVDHLRVVEGRKQYAVDETGGLRFAGRSLPFDASEPIGATVGIGGAVGSIRSYVGSYADRGAAIAAVQGDLANGSSYAVLEAAGPAGQFHAYELDPAGTGSGWDPELAGPAVGAWRDDDFRTTVVEREEHPSTWGTDQHYFDHTTSRQVRFLRDGDATREVATSDPREVSRTLNHVDPAYDPHEAVGRTVSVDGHSMRVNAWVDSTNSFDSALSFVSRSAGDSREYVVVEKPNNRGNFHIYEASESWGGGDWNPGRANPVLASWIESRHTTTTDTERRSGTYGTDVYHFDVDRYWDERHVDGPGISEREVDRTGVRETRTQTWVDRADPPPPPRDTSPGDSGSGWGSGSSSGSGSGSVSSGSGWSSPDDYDSDF